MVDGDLAASVLGLVGAVLGALLAVPQAWRAVRRGTAGISSTTFQLLFALGLTWMLYGVTEGLVLLAVSDGVLAAATLVVLGAMVRDGLDVRWCSCSVLSMVGVTVMVGLVDTTWLGWLAAVVSLVLRCPQMRMVRAGGSIDGVSLSMWNIAAVTNACWCGYAVLRHDVRLGLATLLNLVVTAALVRAVIVRRSVLRTA